MSEDGTAAVVDNDKAKVFFEHGATNCNDNDYNVINLTPHSEMA